MDSDPTDVACSTPNSGLGDVDQAHQRSHVGFSNFKFIRARLLMFSTPIRAFESNENTMESSSFTADWVIDGAVVENTGFKPSGATTQLASGEFRPLRNDRSPLAASVSQPSNVLPAVSGLGGFDRCLDILQPTPGGCVPARLSAPSRSSTPALDAVNIGDTVYAKSSLPNCAHLAIALVEDLWDSPTTGLVPTSSALDVLPPPQRIVRLRWLLTIVNIAISRARLPRGSQVAVRIFFVVLCLRLLAVFIAPLLSFRATPTSYSSLLSVQKSHLM